MNSKKEKSERSAGVGRHIARLICVNVAGLILLTCLGLPALGDIYRYKDENGVWHFTNVPTNGKYKLFIKTPRKTSSAYIRDYEGIIYQASSRFGVDESLVKAVIKAESDFDHQAVSAKGAQGLMQLMPETSEAMAVENPFDPVENIYGGTRYLSLLLQRFGNDKRLAVAAYNAGPERVESHRGIPPIPETEGFVEKVMEYYQYFDRKADAHPVLIHRKEDK